MVMPEPTPTSSRQARLLLVTTVPSTFYFLLPYASYFSAKGWQVDGMTGQAPMPAQTRSALAHVHAVSWSRRLADPSNLRAVLQVRRILRDGRYDIVHTHTPIASFVTRVATATIPRTSRPRLAYTAHGFHFHAGGSRLKNAFYVGAEVLAGRVTDRLVVINEEDGRVAGRFRVVSRDRLVMMPGIGIDLSHYRRTPELLAQAVRARRSLEVADGAVLLTVVAELTPRKNIAVAIAALARNADHRLHLVVAGVGPLAASLTQQAQRLGVADRVHLLGSVSDVRPLLLSSAALVLPSRREGLSRAVMEALALGVPVIGSRTRGITDLVEPDGGLLVAPDDEVGLSVAYDAVQSHERGDALATRLADRLTRLSLDHLIRQHERLYAALLNP